MGQSQHLIAQAAQEMYAAEARKESRGAHAHENFPERLLGGDGGEMLSWRFPKVEVSQKCLVYTGTSHWKWMMTGDTPTSSNDEFVMISPW